MSQSTFSPAMRPAATVGKDAPDVFFVLRHYRWLLIIGTLVGVALGLASYVVLLKFAPRYTAFIRFQVLPPPSGVLNNNNNNAVTESFDDVTKFIKRQDLVVKRDEVINAALQSEFFHRTPRPQWVEDNSADQSKALKNAIDVGPEGQTDVFHLSVTGKNPSEVGEIVNALSGVYVEQLRKDEAAQMNLQIIQVRMAKEDLEKQIAIEQNSIEAFRVAHDIPGLTSMSNRVGTTLAEVEAHLIEAEMATSQARDNYDSVKKQVETHLLKLSPEMDQYVESDIRVQNMRNTLLGLAQDRAVTIDRLGEQSSSVRAIDIRIAIVNKQLQDLLDEVTQKARQNMQEHADQLLKTSQATEDDLRHRRDEIKTQADDLDRWIVQYNSELDKLTSLKGLLAEASNKLTALDLEKPNDASRVRQFDNGAVVPGPDDVSFPRLSYCLIGGLIGGAGLSFGLAYLMESTNTRIRTPRDITKTMQLPLLGFVPDQEDDALVNGDLVTSIRTSPTSMIAESFRQIRGRLSAQANGQLTHGALLVSSVSPGGGATTVASNLANGIALNDRRVLLVDANFYRPGLKNIYHNIPNVGLSELLQGKATLDQAIVTSTELPTLHLMGTGARPQATGAELLESKVFQDLLTQLKASYDVVIFDGAPLNLVSDSISLASKVNGVVAVVRAGMIARGTVQRIREQLRQVNANLLGLVLNAAQTHGSGYFKENYKSFYKYAATENRAAVSPKPVATSN